MVDKIFTEGMIIKTIETKYGEIKKLSFKVEEFKGFMDKYDNNGWININLMKSKGGKEYGELDTWKPESKTEEKSTAGEISVEEIPF